MATFGGLDTDSWTPSTCWLWRWSDLRFIGFYLNHLQHPGYGASNWTAHLRELADTGWALWPLWLPFASAQLAALMPVTDGAADGRTAAAAADSAGLERGATIYLDIEGQMFANGLTDGHGNRSGEARYLIGWLTEVRRAGFGAGVYCSWLDATAGALLSRDLDDYAPVIWPFATLLTPRAAWDQRNFRLTPALPQQWPVPARGLPAPPQQTWPLASRVIGCQYDQDQRPQALTWPAQDGRLQPPSRSVDWNACKVPDPAHPRADGILAAAATWGNPDFLDVFTVRAGGIDVTSRARSASLAPGMTLRLQPRDIGPQPAASEDGFDRAAAAVSRAPGCTDLFVLGLDGLVRTAYRNPRETYPPHPWALNPAPGDQARRASPLAAVSCAQDQIDLFYVDRRHLLVTQRWSPSATGWAASRKVIHALDAAGHDRLVAGGSPLAALPSPCDFANTPATIPNQLDVFYVSFDYSDPARPDAWNTVHAQWTPAAGWSADAIAGLTGVAAAPGVTATRDASGVLHLIVLAHDRAGTLHARLSPGSRTWSVGAGPAPRPAPGGPPDTWQTVQLASLRDAVLLTGVTRLGNLAWSSWAGGRWSAVSMSGPLPDPHGFPTAAFSAGARLLLARRGPSDLDVLGITEPGELKLRSLHVDDHGTAVLAGP